MKYPTDTHGADIAQTIFTLESPLKFLFLANCCGSGKTPTYVGVMSHLPRMLRNNQDKVYKPILVLTVSSLAISTYDKIKQFCGQDLEVFQVYGDPKNEKRAFQKKNILNKAGFANIMNELDPRNPDVSKHRCLPLVSHIILYHVSIFYYHDSLINKSGYKCNGDFVSTALAPCSTLVYILFSILISANIDCNIYRQEKSSSCRYIRHSGNGTARRLMFYSAN